MDADQAATFFAVMLIGGAAGLTVAMLRQDTREQLRAAALPLAGLIAVGATAGSLYFSESAGFLPCDLCWFQRIAMYPMAVLLPLATLRRDTSILLYALALSVIGGGISIYHIQLQLFPEQSSLCEVSNPCSGKWVEAFGWMSIPQMAGLSFALIAALSAMAVMLPDTSEGPPNGGDQ